MARSVNEAAMAVSTAGCPRIDLLEFPGLDPGEDVANAGDPRAKDSNPGPIQHADGAPADAVADHAIELVGRELLQGMAASVAVMGVLVRQHNHTFAVGVVQGEIGSRAEVVTDGVLDSRIPVGG